MPRSDRERAARVLAAVRALPAGALARATANAQGGAASLLREVERALAAPDPESAIARAFEQAGTNPAPLIAEAVRALENTETAAAAVEPLRVEIDRLLEARKRLAEAGTRIREQVAGEVDEEAEELSDLLAEALDLLGDDGPFAGFKEAIAAIEDVRDGVGVVAGEAAAAANGAHPRKAVSRALAGKLADARRRRDAIAEVAARLEQQMPALLDAVYRHVATHGEAIDVAELAAAEAALRDDEPGAEERWSAALDAAVAAEVLPLARIVAERVQAGAVAGGRIDRVAASGAKLAALAEAEGDDGVELGAVCAEALARAQMDGGEARARELVRRAFALAGEDPVRSARAHLLEGQVLDKLGDEAGARAAFRAVMRLAKTTDGVGHELGWAAFELGRLESAAGQRSRAGQNLELAQKIGRAAGDALLFALAARARIDLADDRAAAEAVLAEAEDAPPEVREELEEHFRARQDV